MVIVVFVVLVLFVASSEALPALCAAEKAGVADPPPSISPPMTAAAIARRICPLVLRSVVRIRYAALPYMAIRGTGYRKQPGLAENPAHPKVIVPRNATGYSLVTWL